MESLYYHYHHYHYHYHYYRVCVENLCMENFYAKTCTCPFHTDCTEAVPPTSSRHRARPSQRAPHQRSSPSRSGPNGTEHNRRSQSELNETPLTVTGSSPRSGCLCLPASLPLCLSVSLSVPLSLATR